MHYFYRYGTTAEAYAFEDGVHATMGDASVLLISRPERPFNSEVMVVIKTPMDPVDPWEKQMDAALQNYVEVHTRTFPGDPERYAAYVKVLEASEVPA